MTATKEIFATERLSLRTIQESDHQVLFDQVLSCPDVMRFAFAAKVMSRDEAGQFIARSFDLTGDGKKAGVLTKKDSKEPIGFAGLLPCSALAADDFEIGFVLAKSHWGKGYATEIGVAQIEFGFNRLGLPRLLGCVAPGNAASVAALKKLGMNYQTTVETGARGTRDVYVVYPH